MLARNASLVPSAGVGRKACVFVIGFLEDSIAEMRRLLETLDADLQLQFLCVVRKINPATYVGKGKLEEIKLQIENCDYGVIDTELSPNQLRNIERALGKPVVDRPGVILEIFSRNARTKEAKNQVELARLEYLLPRLTHLWTHFERQRGGIGLKGMGESQIEIDRRLVKDRISLLKNKLKDIREERTRRRSARKEVLKVAIVGYTNAGKSTLLNSLTDSDVLAENRLFATLDASVRRLDPDSRPPVVIIDTVGFISRLPTDLIASFRSTLEEISDADLIVHVVDASSPQAKSQIETTLGILEDLGFGQKSKLTVLNKIDLLKEGAARNRVKILAPGATLVSSLNIEDVKKLRAQILGYFSKGFETIEVVIPYSESKLQSQIARFGQVEKTKFLDHGTFYRLKMEASQIGRLGLDRFRMSEKSGF